MQVVGKIVKIKATETIPSKTGGKDFVKREFWLELPDERFPQTVSLELTGDKVDVIDAYQEGQDVSVEINLRGRIWQDKCFNTLSAWRIQPASDAPQASASPASAAKPAAFTPPAFEKGVNDLLSDASDDLPF